MNPPNGSMMQSPHKPTLITAVIAVIVIIVIYHLLFSRKR